MNVGGSDRGLSGLSVLTGHRLGVYHLQERIGAGGMGEVYRARDTRLGRDVAIKILPRAFTADPDRLARFEREARVLAALNHPNIATIHGVEETDVSGPAEAGHYVRGLVMELVDGETLAERIARSGGPKGPPLRLEEALHIARQIAEALEAAHEKGIIHRDLKPANVKITPGGLVKVLDFGLAKVALGDDAASQAPTATMDDTREGMILGTAAYMSPEQARGQPVDKRTDIWAFGCVLYEMLTGRAAFERPTISDTIAAILQNEPDWHTLPHGVPVGIQRLLHRCLEKYPKRRLRDIGEARFEFDHAMATRTLDGWGAKLAYAIAAAAILLLASAAVVWRSVGQPPAAPARVEQITAFPDSAVSPAFSPDGRMITFIRGPNTFIGSGQIYVKVLPDGEPTPLTHDEHRKMHPVFSADGSRVAYTVSSDNLAWDTWVVPLVGGQAKLWLPNASGLSWIDRQRLLFSEIKDNAIHMALVTSTEGRSDTRDVYVPESVRGMAHRSYRSPDGAWVLTSEMDAGWLPCRLIPFDGTNRGRPVGPGKGSCTHAAWSPDGRWMYFSSDASGTMQIWRQRFPDGPPEQITTGPTTAEGIAIAPDGQSLVTSLGLEQRSVWIHENGASRQISSDRSALLPAWGDGFPTSVFSPDGKRMYFLVQTSGGQGFGGGQLWSADLETGGVEAVLPGTTMTTFDISRDGQRVVFAAFDEQRKSRMWLARVDRRSPPQQLAPPDARGPVFADDQTVFFRGPDAGQWFIYEMRLNSDQTRKLTSEPAVNSPVVSPDGQWIVSWTPVTVGGENLALVKAYPRNGGTPIVICRSCFVKWTRDMRFLFLSSTPGNFMGAGQTRVIALPPGRALPPLPPDGITSEATLARLAVVQIINEPNVFPGLTSSTYAFERQFVQRNLYSVPIP